MAATLGCDTIEHTNGTEAATINTSGRLIPSVAGGIIQMQYKMYDGHTNQSVSVNTDTELLASNLNPSITPTSTSSIIRIDAQLVFEFSDDDSTWNSMFYLYRGGSSGTRLGRAVNGNRNGGIAPATRTYTGNDNSSTLEYLNFTYFDTPSTTSAVTYTLGLRTGFAQNMYYNRTKNYDANNTTGQEAGVSMIALTEIAG